MTRHTFYPFLVKFVIVEHTEDKLVPVMTYINGHSLYQPLFISLRPKKKKKRACDVRKRKGNHKLTHTGDSFSKS